MRRISTLLLLMLIVNLAEGQEYESLIDTTKQWNILQYEYDSEPNYDDLLYVNTIGERFRGDTLINGLHYSYLETCKNDSEFNNWQRSSYLFREDTINGKVYVLNYGNEFLIYDFSLNIGDTMKVYETFIVDSIKTEFIANKNRKVIYFGNTCEGFAIIEGLGTYFNLLEPISWCNVGGNLFDHLLCFSQNNEILFQNGENCYEYQDYTEISEESSRDLVLIYPNPVSDRLVIKMKENFIDSYIIIYTIEGRLAIKKKIQYDIEEISTDRLNNGIYLVKIVDNGNVISSNKIIVNRE